MSTTRVPRDAARVQTIPEAWENYPDLYLRYQREDAERRAEAIANATTSPQALAAEEYAATEGEPFLSGFYSAELDHEQGDTPQALVRRAMNVLQFATDFMPEEIDHARGILLYATLAFGTAS